jgi:tyrosine-protein kinase Etk/Wzc
VAKTWFNLPEYAWGGEEIRLESLQVPPSQLDNTLTLVAGEQGEFALYSAQDELLLEGRVGERVEGELPGQGKISLFVSLLKSRPGTHFNVRRLSELSAISNISSNYSVGEKGRQSAMLSLSMTGPDRGSITTQLNHIANTYVRQNVEWRSEEAERTLKFLEEQLPALKEKVNTAELLYNNYRLEKGSVDLAQETQTVLESVVTVESQLVALQQEREELRQRFKPAHPTMQALDSKILRLKANLETLDNKVENLPETQQEALKLSRDVQVNTELYTTLLNTAQELRVAKAGTVGNVRVIDQAAASGSPIKPRKMRIVSVSTIAGLFFAVFIVFIHRKLQSGVEDPDEAERQLGVPVFASVPHSDLQEKLDRRFNRRKGGQSTLLTEHANEDPAIESLRSLRTTLHFRLLEAPNNILLVTGPSPGIGKTFIGSNLCAVLALSGKRILLIDCDMRKGMIHRHVRMERSPGLSELIAGSANIEEVVRPTTFENLSVITSGKLPPNPAELLLHPSLKSHLKSLSTAYDFVLLDAPPVLAVTDAAILGREAGTTLVLARAGQHSMHELEQTIKRLQNAGVDVRGLIFNDMALYSSRYSYGYGYKRYTYQYSYNKKRTRGVFGDSWR